MLTAVPIEQGARPETDPYGKLLPGVSGAVKPYRESGRHGWRWGQIARELHRLWEESCNPANPITLPEDAAKAAVYIAEWMEREWDAGRRPAGMVKAITYNAKKIGDRIRRRHKATCKRDNERFMGSGAEAYKEYHRRMLDRREEAALARKQAA